MNQLLFGDNINRLRDTKMFPDASVDLVYLDPPFNSSADYNVLFKEASGEESQAQFHAFTDTWHWADAAETYREFHDNCKNTVVVEMMESLYGFLRASPMMAYLAMMAPRLVELHRILKPTGSLYLHCDPTASHYLRMLLDGIFGSKQFVNEIIWKRTSAHNDPDRCGRIHDVLLFYAKGETHTWNAQYTRYDPDYIKAEFRLDEETQRLVKYENLTGAGKTKGTSGQAWRGVDPGASGRHWAIPSRVLKQFNIDENLSTQDKLERLLAAHQIKLGKDGVPRMRGLKTFFDELPGIPLQSIWDDIPRIGNTAKERLGYDTQKPQALLERIISASSNEGDLVLDPFCGCGTAVHAAQKLNRKWIGIDITYLAINLIKHRLEDAFGEDLHYEEKGQPTDFGSAKALAELDKWQFQQWALSLINARPRTQGEGKGADRGVDGMLYFYESEDKFQKILVQIKGGGVQRDDVPTLIGDVSNQKFAGGVLITLEPPTTPMRTEAAEAGRYTSKIWHEKDYPKIQILTIEGLMNKTERLDAPPQENPFAKAQREGKPEKQEGLKIC